MNMTIYDPPDRRIHSRGYDPETRVLQVRFKGRTAALYRYYEVSQSSFDAFEASSPRIAYLNMVIATTHRYERVRETPLPDRQEQGD